MVSRIPGWWTLFLGLRDGVAMVQRAEAVVILLQVGQEQHAKLPFKDGCWLQAAATSSTPEVAGGQCGAG